MSIEDEVRLILAGARPSNDNAPGNLVCMPNGGRRRARHKRPRRRKARPRFTVPPCEPIKYKKPPDTKRRRLHFIWAMVVMVALLCHALIIVGAMSFGAHAVTEIVTRDVRSDRP